MYGPVMPEHLRAKKKVETDDEEDAVIGPVLPSSGDNSSSSDHIGPQLPPSAHHEETHAAETDNANDNDSFGPALPPHLLNRKKAPAAEGPERPKTASKAAARKGPSLPQGFDLKALQAQQDSDDDAFGPMPMPSGYEGLSEELEFQQKMKEIEERASGKSEAAKEGKLERGDWMLSKRRKVLEEPKVISEEDKLKEDLVRRHNEAMRPKSLMDMHSEQFTRSKKYEEDDISKRRFDRDKDLVSRRIDSSSKQRMLEQAGQLDSKFSHGRKNFL
ncbi:hypothetical protein HDU96_007357 [Phlyctochytrium bullatum]|nr:hypothetical protein HDU96_007357 [Phlyctochytrium bullatum]